MALKPFVGNARTLTATFKTVDSMDSSSRIWSRCRVTNGTSSSSVSDSEGTKTTRWLSPTQRGHNEGTQSS